MVVTWTTITVLFEVAIICHDDSRFNTGALLSEGSSKAVLTVVRIHGFV